MMDTVHTRRERDGVLPLLAMSVTVVIVTAGAAQGLWIENVHNGLLALAFTGVGAYVLHQQPTNRCAIALPMPRAAPVTTTPRPGFSSAVMRPRRPRPPSSRR